MVGFQSGEADHPDKADGGHRGFGSGGEDGRGGRRKLDPHGDEGPEAGPRPCQHGGSAHCRGAAGLSIKFVLIKILLGGEGADCALDEETASVWFDIWSSSGGGKESQRERDLVPEAHIRPRPLQPHKFET